MAKTQKNTNDLILELTAETKKSFEDLNKIISEQRLEMENLRKLHCKGKLDAASGMPYTAVPVGHVRRCVHHNFT